MGKIFGIVEIESEEKENSKIINMIAEEMQNYYYGSEISGEEMERLQKKNAAQLPLEGIENIESIFETALQNINQKLTDMIKNEQIKMLPENLNVIIGVIKNKSLYFTHLGDVNAFLLHKKKNGDYTMVNILENTERDKDQLNLIKIFSNIISGNISSDDILLFTTPSLLDYFSLDRLKTTLTSLTLPSAIHHLKTCLEDADPYLNVGSVIIKLVTKREKPINGNIEEGPISTSQASMAELSLTHKKTKELLTPSLFSTIFKKSKDGVIFLGKQSAIAADKYREWKKQRKEEIKKTTEKEKKLQKRTVANTSAEISENKKSNKKTESLAEKFGESASIINEKKSYISAKAKTTAETGIIIVKKWSIAAASKIKNKAKNVPKLPGLKDYSPSHLLGGEKFKTKSKESWERIKRIGYYLKLKYKRLPHTSKILLLITLALIALFLLSLFGMSLKNQKEISAADFNQKMEAVQDKINAAEASIIYNNEEKGRNLLSEAQSIISGLTEGSEEQEKQKKDYEKEIDNILGKIRHMRIINDPVLLADITQSDSNVKTYHLVANGENLYTFNPDNNVIYRINLSQQNKIDILEGFSTEEGHFNMATVKNNSTILFFLKNNGVAELNETNNSAQIKNITIAGDNPYIKDISVFSNKLYLLDTNNNEIYKHESALSGYTRGTGWLRENINIRDAVSLAVDGSIYLLKKDGEVIKMTGGTKDNFSISKPDPKWKNPLKIFTGSGNKYIYILDPGEKRILVYDKNGKLVIQYFSEKFSDLRDFAVNEADKQIYLLSGSKIYGIIAEEL